MIQVLAGTIALHKYITDYSINVASAESANSFTRYDGKIISPSYGHKTTISCTLKKVPHDTAENIAEVVKSDSFSLTYTTPIETTSTFKCTKYNAVPKCSDPREKNPLVTDNITWNITMTLESTDYGGSGGGL